MKRLYTLATALAFGATALMAQTMIVVDKSDNQYRFGVDRIAQITFEEAVDPVVEVTPTYIQPYGSGNVDFVFQDLQGSYMIDLDIYGTTEATYLEAGTYTVDNSNAPFTIGTTYSRFYPAGPLEDSETIASGKMTVEDNDGVYTINIDMTSSAGTAIKARYEGELSTYTSKPAVVTVKEVTMSACRYGSKNEMEEGEFYLKLNDANWNYEMTIDLFADPSETSLPAGTYTLTRSTDHTSGSMSYQGSSIDIYDTEIATDKRGNVRFSEATLTVTKSGDTYSLLLEATLMNELQYKITYNGEIAQ